MKVKLLAALLLLGTLFLFASCKGNEEQPQEHKHTWKGLYSFDDSRHWKSCTGCDSTKDEEKHDLDDKGICRVCENPIKVTEGVTYELSEDKTYAIVTGVSGTNSKIRIADEYEGVPVKEIGKDAFRYNIVLSRVVLPKTLTTICDSAFHGCTSLIGVVIPDSVTTIGKYAFYGCNKLLQSDGGVGYVDRWAVACNPKTEEVVLRENTVGISEFAFYECESVKSVAFPKSLKIIGNNAFQKCTKLESVHIGEGVKLIGRSAFKGCESVSVVSIPNSTESIGEFAFNGCVKITEMTVPFLGAFKGDEGNASLDYLFANKDSENREKFVPQHIEKVTVTSGGIVGDGAFRGYGELTKVDLAGVSKIGSDAFCGCVKLAEISIPTQLESIGSQAFSGCDALKRVFITDIAKWCGISFSDQSSNPLCYAKTLMLNGEVIVDLEIPQGVTNIPSYAFSSDNIGRIVIPDSVTSLGNYAFAGCVDLQSISIPESITAISDHAFKNCSSLESVTIPQSVTSIGSSAFESCSMLNSVAIPDSVVNIGNGAFKNCKNLTEVEIPNSITKIENNVFFGCSELKKVTIPTSVISIGSHAFEECDSLNTIDIPNGVQNIGASAFAKCYGLNTINIPNGVQNIGASAFANCYELKNVTVPSSVLNIGIGAFSGCSKLASIKLPFVGATESDAENSHFGYIFGAETSEINGDFVPGSLKEVNVYKDTDIAPKAFGGCRYIETVVIGDTVTSLGDSAFANCTKLNTIKLPFIGATENDAENSHFGYIFGAPTYENNGEHVPDSVKNVIITSISEIRDYAFFNCKSIVSVSVSEGLKEIGDSAFKYCYAFENLNVGDDLERIGDSAFKYCENITVLNIGPKVNYIDDSAFEYCYSLAEFKVAEENNYFKAINSDLYTEDGATLVQYAIGKINKEFTVPIHVKTIGKSAFMASPYLENIVISENVEIIGDNAFWFCSGLTSVTIGEKVEAIGDFAFANCTGLQTVVISDSVKSIGDNAFWFCSELKNVTIGNSVISIGYSAFGGCAKLTGVIIPDSVTSIGAYAFGDCDALSSAVIGNSVETIGDYAFYDCSNLATVFYRGTEDDWSKASIGLANDLITSATCYYYSEHEPNPETNGNYWHYGDNGEIVIWGE